MEGRPIFYIRHAPDWPCEKAIIDTGYTSTPQYLYNCRAIAIHFGDKESWNPKDYEEHGPTAIKYMNESNEATDDRYIFASYKLPNATKVLLGKPKIGSKCFLRQHLAVPKALGLKLLLLQDVQEITLAEFPYAYLLAPKKSTFVQWKQCQQVANAFIDKRQPDLFDPNTYLPAALEIACEEYLRQNQLLRFKTFRLGGTLKSFDITGLDHENRLVIAQVKNRTTKSQYEKFIEACQSLSEGAFYFFAGNNASDLNLSPIVKYISLSNVLKTFNEDYLAQLARVTL